MNLYSIDPSWEACLNHQPAKALQTCPWGHPLRLAEADLEWTCNLTLKDEVHSTPSTVCNVCKFALCQECTLDPWRFFVKAQENESYDQECFVATRTNDQRPRVPSLSDIPSGSDLDGYACSYEFFSKGPISTTSDIFVTSFSNHDPKTTIVSSSTINNATARHPGNAHVGLSAAISHAHPIQSAASSGAISHAHTGQSAANESFANAAAISVRSGEFLDAVAGARRAVEDLKRHSAVFADLQSRKRATNSADRELPSTPLADGEIRSTPPRDGEIRERLDWLARDNEVLKAVHRRLSDSKTELLQQQSRSIEERVTLVESLRAIERESEERVEALEKRVKELEESKLCAVCRKNLKDTVFDCGHCGCHVCCKKKKSCHVCKRKIKERWKFYID